MEYASKQTHNHGQTTNNLSNLQPSNNRPISCKCWLPKMSSNIRHSCRPQDIKSFSFLPSNSFIKASKGQRQHQALRTRDVRRQLSCCRSVCSEFQVPPSHGNPDHCRVCSPMGAVIWLLSEGNILWNTCAGWCLNRLVEQYYIVSERLSSQIRWISMVHHGFTVLNKEKSFVGNVPETDFGSPLLMKADWWKKGARTKYRKRPFFPGSQKYSNPQLPRICQVCTELLTGLLTPLLLALIGTFTTKSNGKGRIVWPKLPSHHYSTRFWHH